MKYGSFIKKMAEEFATGWENLPDPYQGCATILSIHEYDQAYHNK